MRHLEYCISAWNSYYSKDKEPLERVKRFTKMVNSLGHLPHTEKMERLQLWSWPVWHWCRGSTTPAGWQRYNGTLTIVLPFFLV